MRTPERLTRTVAEIVTDIAKALGTGPESKAWIQDFVEAVAGSPTIEFAPMEGNRKANKAYAREIIRWINEGQKLIAGVPETIFLALFCHEQNAPLNSPEAMEALTGPALAKHAKFTAWLANLRARCEWVIQKNIGEHGHAGSVQKQAAIAAINLCEKFGRPLAWSSPTSAYRTVARLLYEAMTGEYDKNIERACELMASRRTQTEKRLERHQASERNRVVRRCRARAGTQAPCAGAIRNGARSAA
jgi:hypothetical protein